MTNPSPQGFVADSWLGQDGIRLTSGTGSLGLTESKLKGLLPLISTPRWALHSGLCGELHEQQDLLHQVEQRLRGAVVLDLGPSAHPNLSAPTRWMEVLRHTRHLDLQEPSFGDIPKHRQKQERRFFREGGRIVVQDGHGPGWQDVLNLHDVSRNRKGLNSHMNLLEPLLSRVAPELWTFCVLAVDEQGQALASGGFVLLANGTCVYAFGGQKRSAASGRASVAMLLAAIREAQSMGCQAFDFGGSLDPGVDQFYAEFGAKPIPLRRWVFAPFWFRYLVPWHWRSWTQSSPHF